MKKLFEAWCGISLVKRIVAGLIIGAILGIALPQFSGIAILGSVFVGALKAVAPLLVFFLVISSLCHSGKSHGGVIRTVIILYMVSILPVIAFIILTRPIHACSHYSFRSAANKAGRAGNWILEFSAYPGVCILSTRVRMWRMLIRHRRTRVSESKQTTDM